MVFATLSAGSILDLLRRRIVLNADTIESHGLFSVRKLARNEIAGYRTIPSRLQIVPSSTSKKKLHIPTCLTSDEYFDAWFASFPDLDLVEQSQSVDQLLSDRRFGVTEEQRRETFIRAHSIANGLNGTALLAALWGFFYPHPPRLVVITWIALPALSLLLLSFSNGVYAVSGVPNEIRPSVVVPVFLSPMVMFFNLRGSNFLHPMDFLLPVVIATIAMTLILVKAEPVARNRFSVAALSFMVLALCSCGMVAQADRLFDRHAPQTFHARVLNKGRVRSGDLLLAPWGPISDTNVISVNGNLFNAIPVGQSVCIQLHPGALHVLWYHLARCR
ncbi:MAG: hypothetical protein ABSG69_15335 [Candidatus Acidiferrum sp.]